MILVNLFAAADESGANSATLTGKMITVFMDLALAQGMLKKQKGEAGAKQRGEE